MSSEAVGKLSKEFWQVVATLRKSKFYTIPSIPASIEWALKINPKIKKLGEVAKKLEINRVCFVGNSGSWVPMWFAKYLLTKFSAIPSEAFYGYELACLKPEWLGQRTLVILNSFSGESEDILASLNLARQKGACTVAILKSADSSLGRGADYTICYGKQAWTVTPMAIVIQFCAELASSSIELSRAVEGLENLRFFFDQVSNSLGEAAFEAANRLVDQDCLWVLGSGPLWGMAYKTAATLVENLKLVAAAFETSEFRHGFCEIFSRQRQRPGVLVLTTQDETYFIAQHVVRFLLEEKVAVESIDLSVKSNLSPLLSPLLAQIFLEHFVVYLAALRGIGNLEQMTFMGTGRLALSGGAWP